MDRSAGAGADGAPGLADLLLRRLDESGRGEEATVTVAELHRTLIPYARCRDALGFATKAEYDVALLRLLRDRDVVRVGEGDLAEAVDKEWESPEPGLRFLEGFAASPVEIRAPEAGAASAASEMRQADSVAEEPPRAGGTEDASAVDEEPRHAGSAIEASSAEWLASLEAATGAEGEDSEPAAGSGPMAVEDTSAEGDPARRCRDCDRGLPARRGVRFCPHCGADQTVRRCRSCGERLEPEWGYCPRCGEAADGSRDDEGHDP